MMNNKEKITVAEAGARGGRATLEARGRDFFRKIGSKGGQQTAKLYGDLLKDFGRRGGRPRRLSLSESMGGKDREEKEDDLRSAPDSSLPPNYIMRKRA